MIDTPALAEEAPITPIDPVGDALQAAAVLRRFRVVFNAIRTHFQQVEKQVGLGGAQVWALSLIQAQPGIGVSELASRMDIHQSTTSNLLRALMQKQLVRQAKSDTDRRSVHLYIEPAGQALLAQAPGPFEGVLPGALAQLPPATLARLDQDLAALIALLKADESAGQVPLAQL